MNTLKDFDANQKAISTNEMQTSTKDKQEKISQDNNSKSQQIVEINSTISQKNTTKNFTDTNSLKNDKLTLSPSLNFISNIKHSSITNEYNYESTVKENKKIATPKSAPPKKIKEEPIKEEAVKEKIQEPEPKHQLKIQRQNTQEDINHVIKRFNKNNNPALSLFVAKKYYEIGDYHKSYNYALITNEINDNIDASWIIFAKSLVKLNQKNEAISTLKKYIKHSNSSQARILLEEITSGKFK
nr:CDC27 family protein [uncultured Sulfurimonas sp.]